MFDPSISLKTLALMKQGLEEAGLHAHLMAQPVGFHTQEIEKEVLRRVEEAKKVMEETMMKELELRKQEQLEEAKKREVRWSVFLFV